MHNKLFSNWNCRDKSGSVHPYLLDVVSLSLRCDSAPFLLSAFAFSTAFCNVSSNFTHQTSDYKALHFLFTFILVNTTQTGLEEASDFHFLIGNK